MDVFFQMPSFVTILDFVGTFAFAISGIRLASAKRFDWFGAYVVGLATAIGGGTIRDVLLDVTPAWMTDPMYLICTAFAMFFVILFVGVQGAIEAIACTIIGSAVSRALAAALKR